MITPASLHSPAAELAQNFFDQAHVATWGIAIKAADHWADKDNVDISVGTPLPSYTVGHDERKAPYFTDEQGQEQAHTLVSFTDEDGLSLCLWAQVPHNSILKGIGVDLANKNDFDHGLEGRRFASLVLEEHEIQLGDHLYKRDPKTGFAYLFSAKEAAFKSLAAPLRTWYKTHDEELRFDVRNFEMRTDGTELGSARRAEADFAMKKMGIEHIAILHADLETAVLTFAGAFAAQD